MTWCHCAPACSRARRRSGSISTAFMPDMSTSTLLSSGPRGAALCPVPCGATRKPCSRATSTTATTSSTDSGIATAAGCWSTARFQARRASFHSGSCGPTTRPPRRDVSCFRTVPSSSALSATVLTGKVLTVGRGERNGARMLSSRACHCDPQSGPPSGRRPWVTWRSRVPFFFIVQMCGSCRPAP